MSILLKYYYYPDKKRPTMLFKAGKAIGIGNESEATTLRYNDYMAHLLSGMADSLRGCELILKCLYEVKSGSTNSIITGGNDIELEVKSNVVQVNYLSFDEWTDQVEGRFTLDEWIKALEGWRHFLLLPKSLDSAVEIEL